MDGRGSGRVRGAGLGADGPDHVRGAAGHRPTGPDPDRVPAGLLRGGAVVTAFATSCQLVGFGSPARDAGAWGLERSAHKRAACGYSGGLWVRPGTGITSEGAGAPP